MTELHEIATLTSKGQITIPKAIRQALGVQAGERIAFDLRQGEVIVTRVDEDHRDPAIQAYLQLLEADLQQGLHIQSLPTDLVDAMMKGAEKSTHLDLEIDGDVDL